MQVDSIFTRSFLQGVIPLLLAKFTIPMDPRAKREHLKISGKGPRCPMCGKFQTLYACQAAPNTEYAARCAQYLSGWKKPPIFQPVHLVYRLYIQTNRRVSDLNLFLALDEILVKEHILKSGDHSIIRSRDGSRVFCDKLRPRAEIEIYAYEEEPNGNQ